jgi:hypothetical protein
MRRVMFWLLVCGVATAAGLAVMVYVVALVFVMTGDMATAHLVGGAAVLVAAPAVAGAMTE